jgi:hypothetical protein
MKKLIIFVVLFVVLLIGAFIFFFSASDETSEHITMQNPVANLTDEEAVVQFDESFVLYLLYSIGADELHNPPLSSDTPKIEVCVNDEIFSAEIKKGSVSVSRDTFADKDIIIQTTKQEAVKMLRDKNYVAVSFTEGLSTIELVESKIRLAAKGYLGIYEELTGKEAED